MRPPPWRGSAACQAYAARGLPASAVARPSQFFDGAELHPTLEGKAARLSSGLAKSHAFLDGNKRVATVCIPAAMKKCVALHGVVVAGRADGPETRPAWPTTRTGGDTGRKTRPVSARGSRRPPPVARHAPPANVALCGPIRK